MNPLGAVGPFWNRQKRADRPQAGRHLGYGLGGLLAVCFRVLGRVRQGADELAVGRDDVDIPQVVDWHSLLPTDHPHAAAGREAASADGVRAVRRGEPVAKRLVVDRFPDRSRLATPA